MKRVICSSISYDVYGFQGYEGQRKGQPYAKLKSFKTAEEAEEYIRQLAKEGYPPSDFTVKRSQGGAR